MEEKAWVRFETSKYVLVHFTRNNRQATEASITIDNITINPSTEAKYLDVTFDKQLRFKSHLQQIIKKGTNAALALTSIAKTTWGVPYQYVRQLFQAVLAPRIDYAAIIWHRPKQDGSTAGTAQVRKLSTVQRLAMRAILGCYTTTSTAAMEIETGLQPTWIHLQTKALLATTRMQCLPPRHPVKDWLANGLRTRTSCISHRSNLENILQQFPITTKCLEIIEPYIRPPW